MKKYWRLFSILAIFCLLLAVSCSTTKLKTVWKDTNYQKKIKKVFIVGVSKNSAIRRLFEDEFVARIKARGLDAFASYTVIPSEDMLDKKTVESKIHDLGVDTVLVTRLVETKQERVYAQPTNYRAGWYSYYTRSYEAEKYLGNYYEYEVVSLETNLYEAQTGALIWSGLSDTFVEGKAEEEIKSFIKVITQSLSEKELI